jgi:hypothetical protein
MGKYLIVFVTLFVGACSNLPQPPISFNKKTVIIPRITPVKLREVDWMTISMYNIDETITTLQSKGQPATVFGLSGQDYEDISVNFEAMRDYIKAQQRIIDAYEEYLK